MRQPGHLLKEKVHCLKMRLSRIRHRMKLVMIKVMMLGSMPAKIRLTALKNELIRKRWTTSLLNSLTGLIVKKLMQVVFSSVTAISI